LLHKNRFFILFVEIEQILMAIYSQKVNAVALGDKACPVRFLDCISIVPDFSSKELYCSIKFD
jgi:hypothetical protein